jgi:ABC-type protease/lipase transport system fused ATPase/permease subunit
MEEALMFWIFASAVVVSAALSRGFRKLLAYTLLGLGAVLVIISMIGAVMR